MDEEKLYGISGAATLHFWRQGVDKSSKAMENKDYEGALREAEKIVADYHQYQETTDKWRKAAVVIVIAAVALGLITAIIQASWGNLIFFAVVGLAIAGILYKTVISKRSAVTGAFYDAYTHVRKAIEHLKNTLEQIEE